MRTGTVVGKRIAVVDDRAIARKMLHDTLPILLPGVQVFLFPGGGDLLTSLVAGDTYNLVIMDGLLTDGYTGPAYTQEILRRWPAVKIVGYSSDLKLQEIFISSGAVKFIQKGVPLTELKKELLEVLSKM